MAAGRKRRYHWTALATERGQEQTAQKSLTALGVLALHFQYRGAAVKGVRPRLPLFEGYLLYRHDRQNEQMGGVHRAKGVRHALVGPRIPDDEIRILRRASDEDGFIVLPECEPPAFALDDIVRATRGAFANQRGEYRGLDQENQRRAIVAFELLGCEVLSSILRYDLAPTV